MFAMSHDALVVGSGPNGLTAAITLARAGRRVLVLEAAARAGGAVATEELTLPGFRHDTFSAVYPAGAASPVFAAWRSSATACAGSTRPSAWPTRCPTAARWRCIATSSARPRASRRAHSGDGERWRAFAAPFWTHFDALRDTMLGGFPPVRGPLRLTAGLGPRGDARLRAAAGDGGAARSARRCSRARARARGCTARRCTPTCRPSGAGSAIAAAYLNLLGHGAGWPSPEGGAGRLADALVSCLRELGGEVRTGATVARVAVERRRVVGVELSGGERIAAPLVIADMMPGALAELAGDALPATVRPRAAPLPLRARDAEGRLGARRPDPLDRARGA